MKVYGHRGAGGEAPENTIAACRHAIERGARYLELDLRLSADEQLVVIHDKTVNRTTSSRGPVDRYDARELAGMDARSDGPPWPRKRDAGIPTLDAVLNATREIKGYHLEVKPGNRRTSTVISELLAERFGGKKASKRVVVTSSDRRIHTILREIAPTIPLGLITLRPDGVRVLEEFDYQQLVLPWAACNPFTVRYAHKRGVEVAAWTVNDPQTIKNLYRLKVDSVITDFPSMALPALGRLQSW